MAETALDLNRRVAEEINAEALRDPNSPYAGKFLGVVDGKVAIVADTLSELGDGLRSMGARPGEAFCIHAGHDHSQVGVHLVNDDPQRGAWTLVNGRPVVQVDFALAENGGAARRTPLADTGDGSNLSEFELILAEEDRRQFGGQVFSSVVLGGAYDGHCPVYLLQASIPSLGFSEDVRAVGVELPPSGLDGIACFPFLNSFEYGNFGSRDQFGLQVD